MKTIKVVAAVIKKQNKVFVTQRGYGEFKDGWEFPGGKIEQGETPQEALKREIKEELDAEIEAAKWLNLNEKEMLSVEWLPADRGLIKKILL